MLADCAQCVASSRFQSSLNRLKLDARVGFDWPDISGVTDKISEEIDELNEARDELSLDAQEEGCL